MISTSDCGQKGFPHHGLRYKNSQDDNTLAEQV